LCWNSIHYYLLFVFKFVVRVVQIPIWTLLGMFRFIALITYVLLPLLVFSYFIGGSNNFWYSLVSPMFSSQVILASLCLNNMSFIPVVAI
jgi:hypothetical protein